MISTITNDFISTVNSAIETAGFNNSKSSEDEFRKIANNGVETVINLGLLGQPYSLENEEEIVTPLKMNYFHIPVNFENPKRSDYLEFSKVMKENSNKNVFIHCAANKRVSVFVAIYMVLENGLSRDSAKRLVNKVWSPNPCWAEFFETMVLTSAINS